MDPHVAQSSLDEIRRLEEATRDEEVRQNFSLPYAAVAALGLFVALASTDLEWPWSVVASTLGFGVYLGVAIVLVRRASVRRNPTSQEWMLYAGLSAGLMIVFGAVRTIGWAVFGLKAHGPLSQGTVAAAVVALIFFASTPLIRRAIRAIMRQDGRRG